MYATRQNKEKVSRRIDGGGGRKNNKISLTNNNTRKFLTQKQGEYDLRSCILQCLKIEGVETTWVDVNWHKLDKNVANKIVVHIYQNSNRIISKIEANGACEIEVIGIKWLIEKDDINYLNLKKPRSRHFHDDSEGSSENEDSNILWRALRPEEKDDIFENGINPPLSNDPKISAATHISTGSRLKLKSDWISSSRSRKVAGAWAANEGSGFVVKFNLPKNKSENQFYDLTNPIHASIVFPNERHPALNFAKASQEVVIKGKIGHENILHLYRAKVITENDYMKLHEQLESGNELYIEDMKVYAIFKTRTKSSENPRPIVLLDYK